MTDPGEGGEPVEGPDHDAQAVVAVIPSRWASARFPGKPLTLIAGVPMVVRVLRNLEASATVGRVLVATDDDRIAEVVVAAGGEVVMTASDLASGTDRVWVASRNLGAAIVVNVQGDEPLLDARVVDALVDRLRADPGADLATPVMAVSAAEAASPDVVTVAVDGAGRAVYFSRATVPSGADPVWRHLGVYAYRTAALERFVSFPPSALERVERLEQLRALELGLRVAAVEITLAGAPPMVAVDRPHDVDVVERLLADRPLESGPVGAGPVAGGPQLGGPSLAGIRLVVLDVDGVLTDGRISYLGDLGQVLSFDAKDGYGIVGLVASGVQVAILSARDSPALRRRAAELGISEVWAGVHDKVTQLSALLATCGVDADQVCYVGDDDPDVAVMARCGASAAPADASPRARAAASVRLTRPGGRGAVRELADLVLEAVRSGSVRP